ncbi:MULTISPECIES: bifunctional tRNA (5-methylaminomethyl-2-thiouridine)(34)-methyltransferase MnmD/FAD-dependent 5-carboxymethylaminomethyl-2-thiouridine(34) oxidoreductase MnmC [Cupriavidus]|jgi:tRNA 5-methylaminomethyl-2-thiouridine biosynthesis bifunctional protein|uniref:tRNA 5-methylaminomethyl-2-thiouridine biosynthesis bifunctional protein MnmC n=1 Tax=Cupriavidus oxalaticus TaxID=96344 RepID=A0A4P7LAH7_9BURK|nr:MULTISPECIES: bifunctional tRNA (5-methylaminomethyl-2-thiouridine)(34)-methyltransferase MnmD/FAD-dependent 5-carboxymethylaminomethyl-2-thiouridine(34) oxidoreductase MnmC [Cupriavidus]MBF6991328.1 bifunctional tRNA (5-methylaminomethyl-2-thiouridine)(34)-methyltransferase MnmD/FAD-dependent 5-carboxymethylaminomethyl-2-thiouridine(34) oxidoreductase MnmC [Cupriavidus sp. IK-TO18]QBY52904.1 bifunctional tRNA (5-methylaminomethyl-2-thiouridine)(34)-methyltransferase MnmD/FAD-dependent 5-carbo
MPRALEPAEPILSAEGTPYSPRYDDVYHSTEGGLAQAAHVFLGGNGLPQAWAGQRQFVIVETGFGQGLNFLATWQAWRDDPRRCGTLHFVSIEKHPFTREGLSRLHAGLQRLEPLAQALQAQWPDALPGLHRLAFDGGQVVLTIALGDAGQLLPRLSVGADAFYLDGFSPARNADMWSPPVFRGLARLARPGATLATYTAAGFVRRGLKEVGFEASKAPGFGGKRDMTVARFRPLWKSRRHAPPLAAQWPDRHAIVIGAGLAGCAVTERLAARGWRITLFDAHDGPARQTSAHRAAAMHAHVSADDSLLSRLSRAGNQYALRAWAALGEAGYAVDWHGCGVLQIGEDEAEGEAQRAALAAMGLPESFVRWMSAEEAASAHRAGVPRGGLWFPAGGWVAPPDVCKAQLARAGDAVAARFGCRVARIARDDDRWHALAADGAVLASAPVLVLANAHEAQHLLPQQHWTMRRVRGQLSTLPAAQVDAIGGWPDCVVTGAGYLLPRAADGTGRVGSSYDPDEGPLVDHPDVHAANLVRLAGLLPRQAGAVAGIDPAALTGYVGVRTVTHNRLPLIGQVADEAAARAHAGALRGAHLRDLPRIPGLYAALAYASRGLTWSALGAELLASQIEGEPLPLEADLADAIDPARLLLRALRHGQVS